MSTFAQGWPRVFALEIPPAARPSSSSESTLETSLSNSKDTNGKHRTSHEGGSRVAAPHGVSRGTAVGVDGSANNAAASGGAGAGISPETGSRTSSLTGSSGMVASAAAPSAFGTSLANDDVMNGGTTKLDRKHSESSFGTSGDDMDDHSMTRNSMGKQQQQQSLRSAATAASNAAAAAAMKLPQDLSSTISSSDVIDIAHVDFGQDNFPLLAVLTRDGLCIFSGHQHRVQLASARTTVLHASADPSASLGPSPQTGRRRRPSSSQEDGYNISVVWSGDARRLCVMTSSGSLLFFVLTLATRSESRSEKVVPAASAGGDDGHLDLTNFNFISAGNTSDFSNNVGAAVQGNATYHWAKQSSLYRLRLVLTSRMRLAEFGGACAVTSLRSDLAVCTVDGFLLHLSWEGQLLEKVVVRPDSQSEHADQSYVTSASFCEELNMMGVVFMNGVAGVLQLKSNDPGMFFDFVNGHFYSETRSSSASSHATCIAISAQHRVVAVGLKSGETLLYSLESPGAKFGRQLTLAQWGVSPAVTGAVASLSWSRRDQNALAVGYEKRGVVVWSLYGCRLMSSISRLDRTNAAMPMRGASSLFHDSSSDDDARVVGEIARYGALSVEWGSEGYHLFVGCRNGTVTDPVSGPQSSLPRDRPVLVQIDFLKAATASNRNMSACSKVVALASDRMMLLHYARYRPGSRLLSQTQDVSAITDNHGVDEVSNATSAMTESQNRENALGLTWRHVAFPPAYLVDNWPVRFICATRDGNQIAAIGSHGFCLYSASNDRWRLFGNKNQEQEFSVCCACWYSAAADSSESVIVCAVLKHSANGLVSELRVYPKNHLDNTSLICTVAIKENRVPLHIDSSPGIVIVFTRCGRLLQYSVTHGKTFKDIRMECVSEVITTSFATSMPLSVAVIPNGGHNDVTCLMLQASGDLVLCHTKPSSGPVSRLAQDVEMFWVADYSKVYSSDISSDIHTALWAYGKRGLQVWFPFTTATRAELPEALLSRDSSFEFDVEVYPLGFIPELGVIVGLSQDVTFGLARSISALPKFASQMKTHPFLHTILGHQLWKDTSKGATERVLRIAQNFQQIPHFSHTLELLLHETIDAQRHERVAGETMFREGSEKTRLRQVISFLQSFPSLFPQVVVQCARKTDYGLWKALFDMIGPNSPAELFDSCLHNPRLHTVAASYLRVLAVNQGSESARISALWLLDACLQGDNVVLAGELVRYLRYHQVEDHTPSESSHPSSPILSDSASESDDTLSGSSSKMSFSGSPAHNLTFSASRSDLRRSTVDFKHASPQQRLSSLVTKLTRTAEEDQEFVALELILSKYARRLLADMQLRQFIEFAALVQRRDIREWLKSLSLYRRRDLRRALGLVHLQFAIPLPESFAPVGEVSVSLEAESDEDREVLPSSDALGSSASQASTYSQPRTPSRGNRNSGQFSSNRAARSGSTSTPWLGGNPIQAPPSVNVTSSNFGDYFSPQIAASMHPEQFVDSETHRVPQYPPHNSNALLYVMAEAFEAKCYGWAIILATVLFRVPYIVQVIRESRNLELWTNYIAMLYQHDSVGYRALASYLQSAVPGLPKDHELDFDDDDDDLEPIMATHLWSAPLSSAPKSRRGWW